MTAQDNSPAAPRDGQLLAVAACAAALAAAMGWWAPGRPGDPLPLAAGALAAALLVLATGYSAHKRLGGARAPRAWLVLHQAAGAAAPVALCLHAARGDWLSPPGALALLVLILVAQGVAMRWWAPLPMARLFARAPAAFAPPQPAGAARRAALAALIEAKQALLGRLSPGAEEGLFRLRARHWFRAPRAAWGYQRLVWRERALLDAGAAPPRALRWWRRLHMVLAALALLGLLAHLVVVLLFAGYAAGGAPPYWWHLAAWGGR